MIQILLVLVIDVTNTVTIWQIGSYVHATKAENISLYYYSLIIIKLL